MYIAGIDGGATKTHCMIGDGAGNIVSEGYAASSNYQIIGADEAKKAISESLYRAIDPLGIDLSDIGCVHLGLSGADFPADFAVLRKICGEILGDIPFTISNDCWLGLRAGSDDNTGVIVSCGTSINAAGRDKTGRECILRSQGYELGNWGGGADLTRDALHWAFRSEECTGPKTRLETEIPALLGYDTLGQMVAPLMNGDVDPYSLLGICPLVFRLANDGDSVCRDLLAKVGRTMGEMALGIIRRLYLCAEPVRVYASGGLTKGDSPILLDAFTATVHWTAPSAQIAVVKEPPAYGAYLLALDAVG
jgi:N-acetylglucosamine kinase-like BadF-type ATPase